MRSKTIENVSKALSYDVVETMLSAGYARFSLQQCYEFAAQASAGVCADNLPLPERSNNTPTVGRFAS